MTIIRGGYKEVFLQKRTVPLPGIIFDFKISCHMHLTEIAAGALAVSVVPVSSSPVIWTFDPRGFFSYLWKLLQEKISHKWGSLDVIVLPNPTKLSLMLIQRQRRRLKRNWTNTVVANKIQFRLQVEPAFPSLLLTSSLVSRSVSATGAKATNAAVMLCRACVTVVNNPAMSTRTTRNFFCIVRFQLLLGKQT